MAQRAPGERAEGRRLAAFRAPAVLAMLVALLLAPSLSADRRDQKAADLYHEGVALIRKGQYKEGAKKISEALARGATEPNEQQGQETRFLERKYDPYYWLGVAQMEMGLDEQALTNFEKSETAQVVAKWPVEYGDLQRRKLVLENRIAVAEKPPTNIVAPTPVVVLAELRPTRAPAVEPTRPPAPTSAPSAPTAVPTPMKIRIVLPTAPVVPGAPTPKPQPTESQELLALRAFRAELEAWARDPDIGAVARELVADPIARIERATSLSAAGPAELGLVLEEQRRERDTRLAPALKTASLRGALDAFAGQRWDAVSRFIALARKADAKASQTDVLECALLATRYVLEGKRDPVKIQTARLRLEAWQQKTGKKRDAMPAFLSPSLRDILQ